MRTRRGKRVAVLAGVIGFLVVLAAGVALKDHLQRTRLLREIQTLEEGIPPLEVLRTRSVPDFQRDGLPCISLCRKFLTRWPRDSEAPRVRGILLRMLQARMRYGDMLRALGLDRKGRFTWCTSLACGARPPRWTLTLGVVEELLGRQGESDPESAP